MDKIGIPRARLLSQQVVGARYFFHSLAPRPGTKLAIALGGRETCRPDYAVDRHHFTYVCLEYVAEGHGEAALNGRRHRLEPGSVFAYGRRTHCQISTDPERPMVKYFLCLGGTEAERALREGGLAAPVVRLLRGHGEVRSVFEDLIREGQHPGRIAHEICLVLFRLLLLKIRASGSHHSRKGADTGRERFVQCKALIDSEADKLATLADVARATGVEASSVCRLFRRYQGISPYQYLLRRKMTLAASHLIEHGSLVKEAAIRVGFSDPYHFSRCFKAVHGVAPSDLLRLR